MAFSEEILAAILKFLVQNTMKSEEYGPFWILVEILAAILKIAAILNL